MITFLPVHLFSRIVSRIRFTLVGPTTIPENIILSDSSHMQSQISRTEESTSTHRTVTYLYHCGRTQRPFLVSQQTTLLRFPFSAGRRIEDVSKFPVRSQSKSTPDTWEEWIKMTNFVATTLYTQSQEGVINTFFGSCSM